MAASQPPAKRGACGRDAWGWAAGAVALALALFHLYTALFGVLTPLLQRFIHLYGVLILAFAAWHVGRGPIRRPGWPAVWLTALATGLGLFFLFALTPERIMERGFSGPNGLETVAGAALVLLVLEAARRTVGLGIVAVAAAFLAYALLGPWMPEIIAHRGYSVQRLVAYLVWTTDGLFGIPLAVSATFVVVFIIFGAMLERLGAGSYFLDLSLALAGRRAGGPALTAVVASGLMGSINGSAVSNVVTTGSFTIPLMIRTGYRPVYAAAVEAAASTGGQIMPPVMGAAAFVLAEMTGVSYGRVALAAAIPAVFYFLCLGFMVHGQARARGLGGVPGGELPPLLPTLLGRVYLLIPLVLLVALLVGLGWTPMKAGAWTVLCLAAVGAAAIVVKEGRFPWRRLIASLEAGARLTVPVAAACAAAGLVIGVVGLTGLGVRFTRLLIDLSGGQPAAALALMGLACMVLGTGLPTTAAYVITAVLGAPALIDMGVAPLAAHLFILYFAIISFITPPVAISAYAAAGLAGTPPMATGARAFALGAAGYLVPFMFVWHPALILEGPWWHTLAEAVLGLIAVAGLAGACEGWLAGRLGAAVRLAAGAAALALAQPWWPARLIGLAVILGLMVRARAARRLGGRGR